MKVNSEIFRAYDIRGIVDEALTEEGIFHIGKAIGSHILAEGRTSILTARDGRISGPRLLDQFQKGVLSSGCNVVDIGEVPTPLLYFSTFKTNISDGVMLTGSHNPKNYNGLKIVINKISMTSEKIKKIKSMIEEESFIDGAGQLTFFDVKNDYLKELKEKIKMNSKMKVCLDCGNGVGGVIAPQAFKLLGLEVIELYSEVNGNFPNHHPDPSNPKNLKDLQKKVLETNSDLGIALDGDGDRVIFSDEKGKIIHGDQIIAVIASDMKKNNQLNDNKVVGTLMSNLGLENYLNKQNIGLFRTKVGDRYILDKMIKSNCKLGGEPSGHILLSDFAKTGDGLLTAIKILSLLKKSGLKASEFLRPFTPIPQSLKNLKNVNKDILSKDKITSLVKTQQNLLGPNGRILLRPSGTEDLVRIMVESNDEKKVKEITETLANIILKENKIEKNK